MNFGGHNSTHNTQVTSTWFLLYHSGMWWWSSVYKAFQCYSNKTKPPPKANKNKQHETETKTKNRKRRNEHFKTMHFRYGLIINIGNNYSLFSCVFNFFQFYWDITDIYLGISPRYINNFDICVYCNIITIINLVSIHHLTKLQIFFSCDENF